MTRRKKVERKKPSTLTAAFSMILKDNYYSSHFTGKIHAGQGHRIGSLQKVS